MALFGKNKTPQSICVLRLSAIGDVCNAVAAIQAIQSHLPDADVTWIVGKAEYQLLKGLPRIEFIIFDKSKGSAAVKSLKTSLKKRKFDVLLNMQVALRAGLVSRHIKAKRRIGFDKGRSKELHSLFINERIEPQIQAHVLDGFMGFAKRLGVPNNRLESPLWDIPVSPEDLDKAKEIIPDCGCALVIAPCASKSERNWTIEGYQEIAQLALKKGMRVILCGGPSKFEKKFAQEIEHGVNVFHDELDSQSLVNVVGETSLKDLLALLKRAKVVLSPDTGIAHMAVSQGTPVVGIYAHSNPLRTGPYGNLENVVSIYDRKILEQTGKRFEDLSWGFRVKGEDIMEEITPAMVLSKLSSFFPSKIKT